MTSMWESGSAPSVADPPPLPPVGIKRIWSAVVDAPHRAGALIVLFLATPQLYLLPKGTVDIALSTIVALLLLPLVLIGARRRTSRPLVFSALFYILLALVGARALALLWSPDPSAGRQPIVLIVQFLVALVLMWQALREDPHFLRLLVWVLWPWIVVQVLLVTVFRLSPAIEELYLKSIAGFFAGQNAAGGLFGSRGNNVLDPTKAGGFFINGNVAGLFLGFSGMAALAVHFRTRQKSVLVVGIAALVGVWITGSKSGMVLSLAMPALALTVPWALRSMSRKVRNYLLLGSVALIVVVALVLTFADISFIAAVRKAFGQRTAIWGFGPASFKDKPLTGLGFDGWESGFAPYARAHGIYRGDFPPHNILLAAWASTGIPGLLLVIMFYVVQFKLVVHRLRVRVAAWDPRFVSFIGAGVLWLMIQAMGENTDFFGEVHILPILALLMCFLIPSPEDGPAASAVVATAGPATAGPAVPDPGPPEHRPREALRSAPREPQPGSLPGGLNYDDPDRGDVRPAVPRQPTVVRREGRTTEYRGSQHG